MPRVPAVMMLALATVGLAANGVQQPVFRGASEMVRVFVTVTDHAGRLATTLGRDQFEVLDDGRPQPIVAFDNTPRPIQIIFLLDASGSMVGNETLFRTASGKLFAELGTEDVARVGTFGHDIVISSVFTRDIGALLAALPTQISETAPTPLWRAVYGAMNAFDRSDDRRRVVLVLSDGRDSESDGFRRPVVGLSEIINRARTEDVMVYGVGIGPNGLPVRPDLLDPGLGRTAAETGGGYAELKRQDDLGTTFAQIARELHSQYLLGYELPKRDGRIHNIDVRVSAPGLEPRARKTYVAPKASN